VTSTSIHEDWKDVNVESPMKKGLSLSKGMIVKEESSYYSFSHKDGK
jgi:hypothetical protein